MRFDAIGKAEFIDQSAPLFADNPNRMGLVHEKPGTKFFFQFDDLSKRSPISIHAVNRFNEDEDPRRRKSLHGPAQMAFQFIEPIVGKHAKGCPCEARRIHQARVTKLVQNDDIAFANQSWDGAESRRITARKAQSGLCPLESRQRALEMAVLGCASLKSTVRRPSRRLPRRVPHVLRRAASGAPPVQDSRSIQSLLPTVPQAKPPVLAES